MASHPLLQNVDILYELCAVLAQPIQAEPHRVGGWPYGDQEEESERDAWRARGDLFAMLLTCRTFMAAALNALWRSLPDFEPLLDVLGFDADEEDAAESELNWARFEWYARRVKSICFGEDEADLPRFIWDHTPLLPNLCTLYWTHEHLDLAPWFFVQSLRHFELSMYLSRKAPWLQEIHSCLNSLVDSPSRLQRLELNSCDTPVSSQLKAFRHLTHLSLPYFSLSSDVWHNLDTIPSLKRLDITYMDGIGDDKDRQVTALSSTTGLKSLCYLDMTGSWDSMLPVMRDLPSTEIMHVKFYYPSWPQDPEDNLFIWTEIARILSTKNIRLFEFRVFSMLADDSPGGINDLVSIEPLFAFHTLQALYMTFDDEMSESSTITDDHIRRLASGLPNLMNLSIHFRRGTHLTVGALIHLATTSPKLEELIIDINLEVDGGDRLPNPRDVPRTSSTVWNIVLRLKPAPPSDRAFRRARTKLLAGVLDRLFPELVYVSTRGGWDEKELGDAVFARQNKRNARLSSRP